MAKGQGSFSGTYLQGENLKKSQKKFKKSQKSQKIISKKNS
jgi:hypothetical protein